MKTVGERALVRVHIPASGQGSPHTLPQYLKSLRTHLSSGRLNPTATVWFQTFRLYPRSVFAIVFAAPLKLMVSFAVQARMSLRRGHLTIWGWLPSTAVERTVARAFQKHDSLKQFLETKTILYLGQYLALLIH